MAMVLNCAAMAWDGGEMMPTISVPSLSVSLNDTVEVYDTVLENALPYAYEGIVFTIDSFPIGLNDRSCMVVINTAQGYDSVVDYHLHLCRNTMTTADFTICSSQLPFVWGGVAYTVDSSHWLEADGQWLISDTKVLQRTTGADSIVNFNLHINPSYRVVNYDTIVENQLAPLPGEIGEWTVDNTNQFYRILTATTQYTSVRHCDSVVVDSVIVYLNVDTVLYDTLCESLLLTPNTELLTPNIPHWIERDTVVLQNVYGADSTVITQRYVVSTTYGSANDTIVENQLPHTFLDSTFYDSVQNCQFFIVNSVGCDSIISYSLFVNRNVAVFIDSVVCDTQLPDILDSGQWTIDSSENLQLSALYTASSGADSVVMLNLTVIPTAYGSHSDTIVENQLPYTFLHHSYTSDTVGDTLMLTSVAGCDSILTYSLLVYRNVDTVLYDTVCSNQLPDNFDSVQWTLVGGQWPEAVHYIRSTMLLCVNGADSVVTNHLIVNPSWLIADTMTLCESQLSLTFDSLTLDSLTPGPSPQGEGSGYLYYEGDFSHQYLTAYGCDSVTTLHLTVIPITYGTHSDTIVENQLPYAFLHHSYISDTVGDTLMLTSATGCDSIITYSLQVYYNVDTDLYHTLCSNQLPDNFDSIEWSVVVYQLSGEIDYIQKTMYQCANGADSVVSNHFAVKPAWFFADTATICHNELPYRWSLTPGPPPLGEGSEYLYDRGDYTRQYLTAFGCDSVATLHLTVNPNYVVYEYDNICSNHLPYTWHDTVITAVPNGIGTYTINRATVDGCDSLMSIQLAIRHVASSFMVDTFCTGTAYSFAGRDITEGGIYVDSLLNDDGCDSLVYLNLVQLPLPNIGIEADVDCQGRVYNIYAVSDVPYLEWNVEGSDWNSIWGDQHGTYIQLPAANQPITVTLMADYHNYPTCMSTTQRTLYQIEVPQAAISVRPSFATREHNEITLLSESVGASMHNWYIDGQYYGEGRAVEYIMPVEADSAIVMLVATGATCSDTAYDTIYMMHDNIYVPNVFVPDLETNNLFTIGMKGIVEFEIHIYNRTGELVYHSTDMEQSWDGTDLNGKRCPQAAYVYHIRYCDSTAPIRSHTLKGTVLLLR